LAPFMGPIVPPQLDKLSAPYYYISMNTGQFDNMTIEDLAYAHWAANSEEERGYVKYLLDSRRDEVLQGIAEENRLPLSYVEGLALGCDYDYEEVVHRINNG